MTWTEHLENLENILLRISEHTDLWQDRTIREIAAAVYDLVKDRAKEETRQKKDLNSKRWFALCECHKYILANCRGCPNLGNCFDLEVANEAQLDTMIDRFTRRRGK
ncbi:MAG: hypothetical protein II008_11780 [Oscillospiraceae bacterium]|nr:hypothetical protein [Oscillospiraceae bacterium]